MLAVRHYELRSQEGTYESLKIPNIHQMDDANLVAKRSSSTDRSCPVNHFITNDHIYSTSCCITSDCNARCSVYLSHEDSLSTSEVTVTYMRGDEADGATALLCLPASACVPATLAAVVVSDKRLSAAAAALPGAEKTSLSVTSPADEAATEAAVSVFLADKSITSGSHNFFTWCITPAHTTHANDIARATLSSICMR